MGIYIKCLIKIGNKLNEENIAIEVSDSTVLGATCLSKTYLKKILQRGVARKIVESVT
jgi:hypothetical protein